MLEIRGDQTSINEDASMQEIATALQEYEREHLNAKIALRRQGPYSIHIRVIDPDFSGMSRGDRHDLIWSYIESLADEIQSEVSVILPFTPEETEKSFANMEFEHPAPSSL